MTDADWARPFYTDKSVLVSGGTSGIGLGLATAFAAAGAEVLATGATEAEIAAAGAANPGIEFSVLDVRDNAAVEAFAAGLLGGIDVLCNCAGVNLRAAEFTPEGFATVLDINLSGTFYTVKYAVPHLKRNGGAIVVTSSVNGTRMYSNTGATAYACTKGAQVVMTKMLALELAKHRIRINAICPGAIETKIDDNTDRKNLEKAQEPVEFPEGKVPLTDGKPGTSEQVAELVLFLASDAASHITRSEIRRRTGLALRHARW